MVFETFILSSGFSLTAVTATIFCKSYVYKLRSRLSNFLLAATGGKPVKGEEPVTLVTDEDDPYGYTLDAADIANQYFHAKNWQEWHLDEEYSLSRPPRKPTIYEAFEKDFLEKIGIKSDPTKRGYYKFDAQGECITLEGNNIWITVAYELNELLRLEPNAQPVAANL